MATKARSQAMASTEPPKNALNYVMPAEAGIQQALEISGFPLARE